MIRAIVVAFDGVFAGTLDARAMVLSEALASHGLGAVVVGADAMAGRTFAEAARALGVDDETVVDLVTLVAERAIEGHGAAGWPVDPARLLELRRHAEAGRRLVLRGDSSRRVVERALALSGATELFSLVRCSDDLPRVPGASSLESSWTAIDHRLRALGVAAEGRLAVEHPAAAEVAKRYAVVSSDHGGAHEPGALSRFRG